MPLIARENPTTQIELIEPGVYLAVCYGVIDLGTHENKTFGGEAHQVLIQWELPDCRGQFERDGRMIDLPRAISKRYTLSLSEKANLRKALESWRGRKFTHLELQGFDLKAILGTACQIQVVHETNKDGRTFAAVGAIMSLPKGVPHPTAPENPLTYFSLEEMGEQFELPQNCPEWVQRILLESKEWREREPSPASMSVDVGDSSHPEADTDVAEDDLPF